VKRKRRWVPDDRSTPTERFTVALQAAVEALEGIGLALAEGQGDPSEQGPGPPPAGPPPAKGTP
jgi:hypothetical protein